jgi:hypothetical protein
MKKRIWGLFLALITIMGTPATAQQRAKGLVFDAEQYRQSVKTRDLDVRGTGFRELPIRLSLRPFCPTPQDQGAEPSCTAWAIAYGAMTIQQAIKRQVSNTTDVNKIAFSKAFVYNRLSNGSADYAPSIEETFSFLRTNGVCFATTFRHNAPITEQPDELAVEEAQARRLLMFSEVYDPDPSIKMQRQVQRFKRFLADSMPIIVGMRLPYSFANLSEKVFTAPADEPLDSAAHALCLIGYDDIDSTFECLNSWGTGWGGDQGFVRIKYADMFRWLCCAYRITPRFWVEKKAALPQGAVVLRRSIGYNGQQVPQYEEIRVKHDTTNGFYQTTSVQWQPGAGFQLVLREVPHQWWVYIFSVGEQGEVLLLQQQQVNSTTVEKVIPTETTQFELENEGTEWLVVLYARQPLPDAVAALQTQTDGSVVARANAAFHALLRPSTQYLPNRMGFLLPKKDPASGALLLLKMEVKSEE